MMSLLPDHLLAKVRHSNILLLIQGDFIVSQVSASS